MADEQTSAEGQPHDEAGQPAQEGGQPQAAGSEGGEAQPQAPRKRLAEAGPVKWLSLAFIVLAAAGLFSFGSGAGHPGILGLGLAGWGLVDLFNQGKGLRDWKGSAAASNLLNVYRALFLAAMGAALLLQAYGKIPAIASNSLLVAAVSFVCSYLIGAYVLALRGEAGDTLSHALLLGGFALQFLSFFTFSVIFSVGWAALFCAASLGLTGWSVYRGVLKSAPSLAPNVALVTLLISLPFAAFMLSQVYNKQLQPVYQASLFVPRFRELKRGLNRQAADLAWSPGNTQPSQPGDIPYSDKIAYVDERGGKKYLSVYAQHEEGGALTERLIPGEHGKPWWNPKSGSLSVQVADAKTHRRSLLQLELDNQVFVENGERLFHFRSTTVSSEDVVAQDSHGQIYSPDGKVLYFAAPRSQPDHGSTKLWKAELGSRRAAVLSPAYKTYPAASPDSSRVLYVSHKDNIRYLQIADGMNGKNARYFNYQLEKELFPAWNLKQTQVLYLDPAGVLKIMSANNKADAVNFTSARLSSKFWKNEKGTVFSLENMDTGDAWQIWTMNPRGGDKKMVYEKGSGEILPPMWASDSGRIAFVERGGGRNSVMTIGRDGQWPRRVFSSKDSIRSLSWSPDASRLAWFTDRPETQVEDARQELWIAEKQSLNPEMTYESDGQLESLTWSPAGEHIAFEEKWAYGLAGLRLVRPDLYDTKIVDITDHAVRSLTAGGLLARGPAFSPQGVTVAFLTEQRSFAAIPGNWSMVPAERRPAALAVAQLY